MKILADFQICISVLLKRKLQHSVDISKFMAPGPLGHYASLHIINNFGARNLPSPVDTGRKLNVHKTFRTLPRRICQGFEYTRVLNKLELHRVLSMSEYFLGMPFTLFN